jgi:hypothetical protein
MLLLICRASKYRIDFVMILPILDEKGGSCGYKIYLVRTRRSRTRNRWI